MRKWRPAYKCVYVIPEIHGNMRSFEIMMNRILPMRHSVGQEDVLIFLGDYIDGANEGAEVIESLVNIKKEFNDRIIMIRGNHEEMMLRAILGSQEDFNLWIQNNGLSTIDSYLKKKNMNTTAESISKNRILDIIPKHHIEFLKLLDFYHIEDNYVFFHGGFNPEKSIEDNNISNFPFDMTSSKYVKNKLSMGCAPQFKDDYVYVGAHNYNGDNPFIHKQYMMLGGGAPSKLYVFELNSMTASAVKFGKSRLYKYNFKFYE
jgi:Calcineurin-like phosphoesterase